jgi:predicted nucleic acid-binding protein
MMPSGDVTRQRLMVDTNIWSRLAEQDQQYQFNKLVRNQRIDVVMPPATLLEVLRTQDRELRRAVTKFVCRKAWRHLRTEAQAEAAELVR